MGKLRMATHEMLRESGEIWFRDVLEKIAGGETVTSICRQQNYTIAPVMMWIELNPERRAAYDKALKIFAESRTHESLDIADAATKEDWQVAKLRVDTNMRIAGKWDKERYGERSAPSTTINLGLDGALVGSMAKLLDAARKKARLPETIDITPDASEVKAQ